MFSPPSSNLSPPFSFTAKNMLRWARPMQGSHFAKMSIPYERQQQDLKGFSPTYRLNEISMLHIYKMTVYENASAGSRIASTNWSTIAERFSSWFLFVNP